MATTPPAPDRPVTSPTPRPATGPASQPSAPPGTPPKPKGELDRRILQAARAFGVVLRNGQTWRGVRLVEMDTWSLLLDTDQGRVLLPKHAVDAYLLDPA